VRRGATIGGQRSLQLGNVHIAQPHEDGQPELGDQGKRVGRVGGHANRRMRLLIRPRGDRGVLEAVELSLVAEGLALPRFLDDLERFAEARLALPVGNAEDVVRARGAAAPDAELEAPLAQVIDGGRFFRDAKRMVERQDVYRGAHVDALGAGGDGRGHCDGSGDDGAAGVEVDLAEPDAVEAQGLRGGYRLEALAKRVGLAEPRPGFFHEDPEVHGGGKSSAPAQGLQGGAPGAGRVLLSRSFFTPTRGGSSCPCSASTPAPTASPTSSRLPSPRAPTGPRVCPPRRFLSGRARRETFRTGTPPRGGSSGSSCPASSRLVWATDRSTSSGRATRASWRTPRARAIRRRCTATCRA